MLSDALEVEEALRVSWREPRRNMARSRSNSAGLRRALASHGGPRGSTPSSSPLNARCRQEISPLSRDIDARKTEAEALLSADLPQTHTKQELFISPGTHAERAQDPHILRLDVQCPLTMSLLWSCSADSAPTIPVSSVVSSPRSEVICNILCSFLATSSLCHNPRMSALDVSLQRAAVLSSCLRCLPFPSITPSLQPTRDPSEVSRWLQ
ncbi:hypothetical protein OH76DRAFT_554503 [Lentinus brumalis]|uniref:Uncharacterized protein n=1 Tax=Lentinus brumalis TaxID=2498619 RepID=A0A371D982_9APHY|nr:hypothetical protein OH76DRAFT_554503 [Polyporus brumalis]